MALFAIDQWSVPQMPGQEKPGVAKEGKASPGGHVYRLTDRRFEKAKDILEQHLAHIQAGHHPDEGRLERELRECWNVGYQELKAIMKDLFKRPRYRLLAASYMQNSNGNGMVVLEFQETLETLYGVKKGDNFDEKATQFWKRALARKAG